MKNYYINIVEGTNQEDLYPLVSSVVNEYSSYPTFFLAECTDEQVLELSNRSEVRLIESLEEIQAGEDDDATKTMTLGRTSKSHALSTFVGVGNWGLIRHTSDANPFAAEDVAYNKTYTYNYDGTGVDFVANLAGMVDVNNAEYKTNGVSRIQQFQWNTLTGMGNLGTTNYATGAQSNHGKAVLAVACSNSCGWATGSNIYILPRNQISSSVDYYEAIQKFHEQKGNSRPTIMVASYSSAGSAGGGFVRDITFRGTTNAQPHGLHPKKRASLNAAMSVGMTVQYKYGYAEAANEKGAIATAVQAMTDAGVIAVNSAGNYNQKCDHPGGSDWNNSYVNENNNVRYYYNRGAQEWSNDSIVVANLTSDFDTFGNNLEELSYSSNRGPRCDTAAAGIVKLTAGLVSSGTYTTSGTSFSAPNVAGMAALVLEKYPTTTPYQMRRFFRETAVSSANLYMGKTTLTTDLGDHGDPEYFNDALAPCGFSGNIAYLDPTLPDDPTALFPTSGSYTYPAEVTESQGINFTTAQINTKLASI
jgi:hypothetical protein